MGHDAYPAIDQIRQLLGDGGVLSDPNELFAYECDGFPIAKGRPTAVAFPRTTREVASCVKILREHHLPIVPRGSGTGLTGGSVAFDGGVIISTTRMTSIESIDLDNRVAVVQAGVRNLALTQAVAAHENLTRKHHPDQATALGGLRFSPDPSSQAVSTVGGNAATNAGGINTLKYGVTCNHILATELVMADGSVVVTGPGTGTVKPRSALYDGFGPDLTSLICGSEGTLGIITRVWCRLSARPRHFRTAWAVFGTTSDACQTVSDIIASGIVPCSMEMLDGEMVSVVEEAFGYGFPKDARALLLVELDGVDQVLDDELAQVVQACRTNNATDLRQCADSARQAELWSVRKRAFGAIGRIRRSYCTQDACIPRSCLADAVARLADIGREFGLRITNVFHAGDGNVHPILLFDEDDPEQVQRVLRASERILEYCVSIGGTITGEHGIGVEKLHLMEKMFTPDTLEAFSAIKAAFDPHSRINDGKLVPSRSVRIQLIKPAAINQPGGAL